VPIYISTRTPEITPELKPEDIIIVDTGDSGEEPEDTIVVDTGDSGVDPENTIVVDTGGSRVIEAGGELLLDEPTEPGHTIVRRNRRTETRALVAIEEEFFYPDSILSIVSVERSPIIPRTYTKAMADPRYTRQ
jgi:Reverse transcriptase (RNA-dependent DNA polymerase)